MWERMSAFTIMTFILSLFLGISCFYYVLQILFNKKITIKVMAESLGETATDKSVIAMVSIVLVVLGFSFFSICIGIYFFAFAVY